MANKIFIRFIVVGIINTIVGTAIMFGLYNLAGLSYWTSSLVNYIFTSVLSFFLNKYFTFGVRDWNLFMVVAFIINIAVCYLAAYGLAKPAVGYLLRNSPLKIRENAALFAGMFLFTGLNYTGQRLAVFKTRPSAY
jgi:putative flippase GtrA